MLPPVDIAFIAEEVGQYSLELIEASELQDGNQDADPRILVSALNDLFECLRRYEESKLNPRSPDDCRANATSQIPLSRKAPWGNIKDIHQLGKHGIDLLSSLAALAERLQLAEQARGIEVLTLPFACWISRHGGELRDIRPVVNGAASLANALTESSELARLYGLLTEVIEAVDPRISQESASSDSADPWRILLINRAIVATRTHQPALMEDAFDFVVENLPGDAAAFFREGMEQMDALDYPPNVRSVMQAYFEQWCGQRVLH